MKRGLLHFAAVSWVLFICQIGLSEQARLVVKDNIQPDFESVLTEIKHRTNLDNLTAAMFQLGERRELTGSVYYRYDQVHKSIAVERNSIRIWLTPDEKKLLLAEAQVENPAAVAPQAEFVDLRLARRSLQGWRDQAEAAARAALRHHFDNSIRSIESSVSWQQQKLMVTVKLKARRGLHRLLYQITEEGLVPQGSSYRSYPSSDTFSIEADLYPIYEEYQGELLPRQRVTLKHLEPQVPYFANNPFAGLQQRRYFEDKMDKTKASTPEGRKEGYWSTEQLRSEAASQVASPLLRPNGFDSGLLLHGKYVSINLHPLAAQGNAIPLRPDRGYSPGFHLRWQYDAASGAWEVIPDGSPWGHRFKSQEEIFAMQNIRDPHHDYRTYMALGFDELQVYYAATLFYEQLHELGLTDPELSTRPMTAYLYDPAVDSMDNAFYDADTINFTTYPPQALNLARDNTTVWHEMGHGFMDRLMGSQLNLAGPGGLSEGVADFFAEIGLRHGHYHDNFPGWNARRILNSIGFFLTNEVHDDGEPYGGVLADLLFTLCREQGDETGLKKSADLVFAAMRFSRDHPELSEQNWYENLLYADELGHDPVRQPGELREAITQSFQRRNFSPRPAERLQFTLENQGEAVEAGKRGSRDTPIELTFGANETAHTYPVTVRFSAGSTPGPYTIEVDYKTGALQGAIHWQGEDEPVQRIAVTAASATLPLHLTPTATCDTINTGDGSCSDYVYIKLLDSQNRVVGKKRFYVKIIRDKAAEI
jgi:hypothetical protein